MFSFLIFFSVLIGPWCRRRMNRADRCFSRALLPTAISLWAFRWPVFPGSRFPISQYLVWPHGQRYGRFILHLFTCLSHLVYPAIDPEFMALTTALYVTGRVFKNFMAYRTFLLARNRKHLLMLKNRAHIYRILGHPLVWIRRVSHRC